MLAGAARLETTLALAEASRALAARLELFPAVAMDL
jgi:hypothetical protein